MAEKRDFKTGYCQSGDHDDCPHEIHIEREKGKSRYEKHWTCGCQCHSDEGLPW